MAAPRSPALAPPSETVAARSWRFTREGTLSVLRRDSAVRRALGVADSIALAGSLALCVLAIGDGRLALPALLLLPLVVLLAKLLGLYDRDANLLHKTTLDELPGLFQLATVTALVAWLAGELITSGGLGREEVLVLWLLFFVLAAATRALARTLVGSIASPERVLFVGAADEAEEFRQKLATSPGVNAELVGCVVPTLDADPRNAPRELVPRLREMAREHDLHRVVLATGWGSNQDLVDAIRSVRDHGLKVSVLPRHARVAGSAIELDHLNGITLLGVRRFEITASSRLLKRSFDLAGSALALLLAAPLMALIALAVKLDTPGPVLFRQHRAGRGGEPFWMLKFRSMVDGAEAQQAALRHLNQADGVFKIRDDPRVTRVGAVIRRFSLDELPQLVNVLRGEMSLVGPRPLPIAEDSRLQGAQRRRLDLRPGITGPWQVLGTTEVPLREIANLDNQYVADWSVWTDVRILLLTIPHVFGRRGV